MAETQMAVAVATEPPKSIQTQYFVTVLQPNSTQYASCMLCKNFTEAKKLYNFTVEVAKKNELVSLLMTINRIHKKVTRTSDLVIARTVGLKG